MLNRQTLEANKWLAAREWGLGLGRMVWRQQIIGAQCRRWSLLALETVRAGADRGLAVGTAVDAGAVAEHLGVGAAQAHRPFGTVAAHGEEARWNECANKC